MSRRNNQRPIYPKQILETGAFLIGTCIIGGKPQRIAAAKRLDVILASQGLRIDSLRALGVPSSVIAELQRLAAHTPAPEFKAKPKPKLVPGTRGRKPVVGVAEWEGV